VDAGEYARQLMAFSKAEGKGMTELRDPLEMLARAHRQVHVQGSTTACILTLEGRTLQAVNLGDSGFLVVRNGNILFRSSPQQHDFNFPFQLGSDGDDKLEDAHRYSIPVQRGDVIVMGTDGLFDNVHDRDVAGLVRRSQERGDPPVDTATHIARLANIRGTDPNIMSPFAQAAAEYGYQYRGGKADDITVVVSYVE